MAKTAGTRERVEPPSPATAASSESASGAAALILDNFASMHQVVQRRDLRLLEHGGPFPDLILIDGAKGQLASVYEALEELGLSNLVAF